MAPSDGSGSAFDATSIAYLIHHVILPPKLPQIPDTDVAHERCLLDAVRQALTDLKVVVKNEHSQLIDNAISTIANVEMIRDCAGFVSQAQLQTALAGLVDESIEGMIAVEMKAQNAGLLIHRDSEDVVFEFFELAPLNEASMRKGRLVRNFPGLASKIPISTLEQEDVQFALSKTIATVAVQNAPGCQPQTIKGGHAHSEERDTTDPRMVTDFLLHLTTALGEPTEVSRITKHTREEISSNGSELPWRRSPLWLLVRVALQLVFTRYKLGSQSPGDLYKAFMVCLVSSILNKASTHCENLGGDYLHAISAKLLRRYGKMERLGHINGLEQAWADSVQSSLENANTAMSVLWTESAEDVQNKLDLSMLATHTSEAVLDMNLASLDTFLLDLASRPSTAANTSFRPQSTFPHFPGTDLPVDLQDSTNDEGFRLLAFEKWVEEHLSSWIDINADDSDTCGGLRGLIVAYHQEASKTYTGIPECLSVMYLTLLELWVACDISACNLFPLLKEYSPEMPLEPFQCLLLPLRSQMLRLQKVEAYITKRDQETSPDAPSLYRDFGHAKSFAVRYFDQSDEHQEALVEIEQDADEKRQAKRTELKELKAEYQELMHNHDTTDCIETGDKRGRKVQHRPKNCPSCQYKVKAKGLTIAIHEWPLTRNVDAAKTTVFELLIPEAYSDWRDASWHMIVDVCESEIQGSSPGRHYYLSSHPDLSRMLPEGYREQRIVPLSSFKGHSDTHYKICLRNNFALEESILTENGRKYAYYDRDHDRCTTTLEAKDSVPDKCLSKLPTNSTILQQFLFRPASLPDGLEPNEVITSVSDCPLHITADEFKSLGSIALGSNLIYPNILAQLAMPGVDFAKVETQCAIVQAIHQVGVPEHNSVERKSHRSLQDPSFCKKLLQLLESAFQRVEENSDSWRAPFIFIQLTKRVLTLCMAAEIALHSLSFLERVRATCQRWIAQLSTRANAASKEQHRSDLQFRATKIALLCVSTYDVDERYLFDVLQPEKAISTLLRCSIIVQEHLQVLTGSDKLQDSMLHDWRSLMFRAFPKIREILLRQAEELDQTISTCWVAFRSMADDSWAALDGPNAHWLITASGGLPVHFNLLTAELLVNGLPLARLPHEYTQHKMYQSLFMSVAMEVAPSSQHEMSFSSKYEYHGYQLHFGMYEGEMSISAADQATIYNLLPARVFTDQLPESFISTFFHWHDSRTDDIVFRPRESPWPDIDDADQWHLVRHGSSWQLLRGSSVLMDITSQHVDVLSNIFERVEEPKYIHATYDTSSKTTEVLLPRLKLEFSIQENSTQIRSKQYRGYSLDLDQDIGTLIGLRSKLVLLNEHSSANRLLLVPEGTVQYVKTSANDHTSITVDPATVVKVHTYSLNTILRQITDEEDLQCKLYLAYLHALTSFCLPDPFTGYTGTESALQILRPAVVLSYGPLTAANVELLGRISRLAPGRSYYPHHLKVMQTVNWDPHLSFVSQHSQFYTRIRAIMKDAKRLSVCYPEGGFVALAEKDEKWFRAGPQLELSQRDDIKSCALRISDFGGESFTSGYDTKYDARDAIPNSEEGHRAFEAASMILRPQPALLHRLTNIKDTLVQFFGGSTVTGCNHELTGPEICYDARWLAPHSTLLQEHWCKLHLLLSDKSVVDNKFSVTTWLATMAYASLADIDIIQVLGSMYITEGIARPYRTPRNSFQLSYGHDFVDDEVLKSLASCVRSMQNCTHFSVDRHAGESTQQLYDRKLQIFKSRYEQAKKECLDALKAQWPVAAPVMPTSSSITDWLHPVHAQPAIKAKFERWHDNHLFNLYLCQLSTVLMASPVLEVKVPAHTVSVPVVSQHLDDDSRYASVRRLFDTEPGFLDEFTNQRPSEPRLESTTKRGPATESDTSKRLATLRSRLEDKAKHNYQIDYVRRFRTSCKSAQERERQLRLPSSNNNSDKQEVFRTHLLNCEEYVRDFEAALAEALNDSATTTDKMAYRYAQAPRVVPKLWLRYLNLDQYRSLSEPWQNAIVEYGRAISHLQRAQRLYELTEKPVELVEEHGHRGHVNWNPEERPEILLMEVESAIRVRKPQMSIADVMISPEKGRNSMMQLVMGGGKSSTIMPIVAATLANGDMLVRIIVALPQSQQMLHTLITKFSGLLNRRIYQMPFARHLNFSEKDATTVRFLCEECRANRGIMLVQPEHLQSFKLMGIDCLATDREELGKSLLDTQEFFDTNSRDVVDESDEIFNPKRELVYPMGAQKPVDFASDRCTIIQEILGLISRFAPQIKNRLPLSIDYHQADDKGYPRIRLLRPEATDVLTMMLAKHAVEYGITGFSARIQPLHVQNSIVRYITQATLTSVDIDQVQNSSFWTADSKQATLLLRGLFAGGLLAFVFASKRYRVNYGLDPARLPPTETAVPYTSKDSPSPRSEFSQTDIVIILTYLSHYRKGLSDESLFRSFELLMKAEQADLQYDAWVADASSDLPGSFRHLAGISLKDRNLCITRVFPALRYSKAAIDYFLFNFCFMRELREFPSKLSGSGWDIGAVKTHATSGFSGTKDTSYTLPLDVHHIDLPGQNHTDAEVLGYLLHDETKIETLDTAANSKFLDAENILQLVDATGDPNLRVILDVGAQILDRSNKEVAAMWLSRNDSADVDAVVFFEGEELSVIDRTGFVESLQTSPFVKQLDRCFIYLDESHTRGIDLKLPRNYRAAVTLGPSLTKDRMMQACMRMRELGKGQSVTFFVPNDIAVKIRECAGKTSDDAIEVMDILCWSIEETWEELRRLISLWAIQGHRYETHKGFLNGAKTTNEQALAFLEDEAQTLEDRYRPRAVDGSDVLDFETWDPTNETPEHDSITSSRLPSFQFRRELSVETQQERQVERPPKMKAAEHVLHGNLKHLARTGILDTKSKAVEYAFRALQSTSAAKLFDLKQFPLELLVSKDFMRTVKSSTDSTNVSFISDDYLRGVQYVISIPGRHSSKIKSLLIVSPYEANLLLPVIRDAKRVTLHIFAPRHNANFAPLDKLDLWHIGKNFFPNSIPHSLRAQLNLFAGTLYLRSYEEYAQYCGYLGLLQGVAQPHQQISSCGFIKPPMGKWNLTESPVPFLRSFVLRIRRQGAGVERTHIGKMFSALRLEESDFETGADRLREVTADVAAEFEQHTTRRRSRAFDPEDPESLFMSE